MMDTQDVLHPHNAALFNLKKKGNSVTYINTDRSSEEVGGGARGWVGGNECLMQVRVSVWNNEEVLEMVVAVAVAVAV